MDHTANNAIFILYTLLTFFFKKINLNVFTSVQRTSAQSVPQSQGRNLVDVEFEQNQPDVIEQPTADLVDDAVRPTTSAQQPVSPGQQQQQSRSSTTEQQDDNLMGEQMPPYRQDSPAYPPTSPLQPTASLSPDEIPSECDCCCYDDNSVFNDSSNRSESEMEPGLDF